MYLDFCNYGTYLMDGRGDLISLGSPVWVWGKFYEFVIRSILSGGWKREKGVSTALNYWLGMDSGVIGVELSDKLPDFNEADVTELWRGTELRLTGKVLKASVPAEDAAVYRITFRSEPDEPADNVSADEAEQEPQETGKPGMIPLLFAGAVLLASGTGILARFAGRKTTHRNK